MSGQGRHKELVVPVYDMSINSTCTAILDMQTFEWRKLTKDGRGSEFLSRYKPEIVTDDKLENIYLLGGTSTYERPKLRKPFTRIYRLPPGDGGWKLLEGYFEAPIGLISIPINVYHTKRWEKLDMSQLGEKSELSNCSGPHLIWPLKMVVRSFYILKTINSLVRVFTLTTVDVYRIFKLIANFN